MTRVKDAMGCNRLPMVSLSTPVPEVLLTMTDTRTGMALVMNDNGCLAGVITDGDVRRYLVGHDNLKGLLAADLMTTSPVTISQEAMLADAEQLMRERHLKWVVALNDDQQVSGLLEWAD